VTGLVKTKKNTTSWSRFFSEFGFTEDEMYDVHVLLTVALTLGNVSFKLGGDDGEDEDSSVVEDMAPLRDICNLLGDTSEEELETALTSKFIVTKGETFVRPLIVGQAIDARDTFAKSIYENLFSWLVSRMNTILSPRVDRSDNSSWNSIGVLDIFGFENFGHNSFEQLCINTANEQLHFFFNQHIFAWELEEYRKEGISAADIDFADNQPQVNLLLGKPLGVFSIIDEEAKLSRGSDSSALAKLKKHVGEQAPFVHVTAGGEHMFGVKHYAGEVKYQITGMLEKNRNTSSPAVVDIMKGCACSLAIETFDSIESQSSKRRRSSGGPDSGRSGKKLMSFRFLQKARDKLSRRGRADVSKKASKRFSKRL